MKHKFWHFTLWFLVVALAFGLVIWLLWNWLVPTIFGLTSITFLQALGLFVLAKLLFGNFGMPWRRHHHNEFHQKWEKMTDEERKEFINRRKRFGLHQHLHDHDSSNGKSTKD